MAELFHAMHIGVGEPVSGQVINMLGFQIPISRLCSDP
jgi:hypothetical protein